MFFITHVIWLKRVSESYLCKHLPYNRLMEDSRVENVSSGLVRKNVSCKFHRIQIERWRFMQFTESNSYVLRLLEALAGQGPALALLKGRGWGGVYNAIDPTEIEILIRCYLYSAKLPRTRTGRVRHSKFDCTENKDVLFRERIIKERRLWGRGSQPSVSSPCFIGFLILALFRLRNI